MKDGKNAFCDPDSKDGLSDIAHSFIAGVMRHIKGICALTNPLVNSYKRLVPGFEAPCYIAWTSANRSALIRVPTARGNGTRIELRNPDPSCNPYLTFALLLSAGLEGIRENLTPPVPVQTNIYDLSEKELDQLGIESLPDSLQAAVAEMKRDPFVKSVLGNHVYGKYVEAKEDEWKRFSTTVTEWETNEYLGKY